MIRLLIIPLIPVFILLFRAWMQERREERQEERTITRPKRKPKQYDHEWPDDDD